MKPYKRKELEIPLLREHEIRDYIKQLFGDKGEPIIFKILIEDAVKKGVEMARKEILNIVKHSFYSETEINYLTPRERRIMKLIEKSLEENKK